MEICFWEDAQGTCPVSDFLSNRHNVELGVVEKINQKFERLETISFQDLVRSDTLKKLKGYENLWEIRISEYRFLGGLRGGQIWLVHAFKKKGNKTEPKHIHTAFNRIKLIP